MLHGVARVSVSSAESFRIAVQRKPLRRLSVELFLVVLAKIALLALIWWLAFAAHPKPDSSPAAIERLLMPSTPPSPGTRP